ncbi:hypothetical protein [Lactococcus lactis]|uniref:hypothetical protein n=1 Tax=Lactococcus lactis TaxID=1358 RepID=UPI003A811FCB
MRVVNERWNELENELGLGLPLNTLSEVDIANKWRLRALNAEKLLNQPQLTIPKSIADEIDKFAHTNWANWQFYFYSDEMSKELIDWFDNGDSEFTNSMIAMVYLNPLTRDLVKVVEG